MAFSDIAKGINYPPKTSDRFKTLDAYSRILAGTLYDHIKVKFDEENDGSGYIKLRERRPSVIWNGASLISKQLAGLLWGDEQMPMVRTYFGDEPTDADRAAEQDLQHVVEELCLDDLMMEVTEESTVGSCAVILRAMDDKSAYIEVVPGKRVTPTFDPKNPNRLLKIQQLYSLKGSDLRDYGYDIKDDDLDRTFWYRLDIDKKAETRFFPMREDRYLKLGQVEGGVRVQWEVDQEYKHGFGEIPVVWVMAPGKGASPFDGSCLFGNIVDTLVEIDYMLSQIGRGYRYSADPMLAISQGELANDARPAGYDELPPTQTDGGAIVKSPTNVLNLGVNGDAKMLEISGQGLSAAGEHVKLLREWALEVVGGMKSDAENEKGAESGRALEMLYQALVLLVKRWRIAVGNKGFIPIVGLILTALEKKLIAIEGLSSIPTSTVLRLVWPTWMTPTGADLAQTANAWQTLAGGSATAPVPLLPRAFVTRLAAVNLGATDTASVTDELEKQVDEDEQKAQEQAQQEHQQAKDLVAAKPASKPK